MWTKVECGLKWNAHYVDLTHVMDHHDKTMFPIGSNFEDPRKNYLYVSVNYLRK
jgi:hypothetical protein